MRRQRKFKQGCGCHLLWVVTALLWLMAGGAATASPPETTLQPELEQLRFEGLSLPQILGHYEGEGFHFIYSSDLVREGTLVQREPVEGPALQRLQAALNQIGLMLRPVRGEKTQRWLIVRLPRESLRIRGRITDAQSQAPLARVRVQVADAGGDAGAYSDAIYSDPVYTDERGRFDILLPRQQSQLLISRNGYARQAVSPVRQERELVIPLSPLAAIEELVVTGSRYDLKKSRRISRHSFDADEIIALPELGDDALRTAAHLPGTASNGLSARPYIRGGLQDETLVLFNNVELLEPFHLKDFQSVFSGLNPSLIKSIHVYTGGFPASYGDRMSGVIDVEPVEELPSLGGEVILSLLTSGVAGYGDFAEGRGNWVLAARRGNLDLVTDHVNPTLGKPSYSDWFGQLSWQLPSGNRLELGGLGYNDDIELHELDLVEGETGLELEGEQGASRYRNAYGWLQLTREHTAEDYDTTTLSMGVIRHSRDGFVVEDEEGHNSLAIDNWFKVWRLDHQAHRKIGDLLGVDFGGRLNYQKGRYRAIVEGERGPLAQVLGIPEEIRHQLYFTPEGFSGGLFTSVRLSLKPWWTVEAGTRWDFQTYGQRGYRDQFSPRLSTRLDLTDDSVLRLSLGRFYQPDSIHELQVGDGVDHYQRAQYTDSVILGFEQHWESGLKLRLEGFYKNVDRPKQRFENLLNPLALVPELAADRLLVAPDRATAKGLEATLSYNPDERLNVWVSYTRASADDQIDGRKTPRSWDQRQSLAGGAVWNHDPWSLSAALRWHSGWQTTRLPDSLDSLEPIDFARNRDRLSSFMSLDLRVSRTWQWPGQSLVYYIELTNALNHDNVGGMDNAVEEDDSGAYQVVVEEELLLPLVPSMGILWRFGAEPR